VGGGPAPCRLALIALALTPSTGHPPPLVRAPGGDASRSVSTHDRESCLGHGARERLPASRERPPGLAAMLASDHGTVKGPVAELLLVYRNVTP